MDKEKKLYLSIILTGIVVLLTFAFFNRLYSHTSTSNCISDGFKSDDHQTVCMFPVCNIIKPSMWDKPPIIKQCIKYAPFKDWVKTKGYSDKYLMAMYGNTITTSNIEDFHITPGVNMIVFNFPNQMWDQKTNQYSTSLISDRICPTRNIIEQYNESQLKSNNKKNIAIPYMSMGDSDLNAAFNSGQVSDLIYRTVELCKILGFNGCVIDIEQDSCCPKPSSCNEVNSRVDRWTIAAALGRALKYNGLELHANGWQNWQGQNSTGFLEPQMKAIIPLLTSMQIMTYGTFRPPNKTSPGYTIEQITSVADDYIKHGVPKSIIMFGIAPYYSLWRDIDGGPNDCLDKCQEGKMSSNGDCDTSVDNVVIPNIITAGYSFRPTYHATELSSILLNDVHNIPSKIQPTIITKNKITLVDSYTYTKNLTYNGVSYNNVFSNIISPHALYSRAMYSVLGGYKGVLLFRQEYDNQTPTNATSHLVNGFNDSLTILNNNTQ